MLVYFLKARLIKIVTGSDRTLFTRVEKDVDSLETSGLGWNGSGFGEFHGGM